MTSSGTTAFNPSLADLVIEAYGRIQVRPSSFTAQHMQDARMSSQMLLAEWSTKPNTPNIWKVALQTPITLVQGTATYNLPTSLVNFLDAYIRTTVSGVSSDRIILPISRNEYAAMPNKAQQGPPTTFWVDMLLQPTVTVWPVPDGNGPYSLNYYALTQIQDAVLNGGATLDIPYRFMPAFAAGLAAKLAEKYPPPPPNSIDRVTAMADRAWQWAMDNDAENVPMSVVPGLSSYFR